jgi:hypothetical protein
MSNPVGTLNFSIDPSPPPKELDRIRNIICALIESESLNSRNGQVILHFDNDRELRKIETHLCRWVAGKDSKPKTRFFLSPLVVNDIKETLTTRLDKKETVR